jgi:hypothetical protein
MMKQILFQPKIIIGDRTILILFGMIIIISGILVYMIFNGDINGGITNFIQTKLNF